MKKIFMISIICLMCCGCSLIPRITYDTKGSVPQSIQKSKIKEKCSGKAVWSEAGVLLSCSKGYFNYASGYEKIERKMTIIERVKSFFNTILGWGIPGLIVICILFPGAFTLIGTIIGRFIEGAYGAGVTALKRVAKAVQKTRKEGKDLNQSLDAELDEKDKEYIAKIKKQEKIK